MRHELRRLVSAVGMVVAGLSVHAAEASARTESASIVVRTYTQHASEEDMRTARRIAGVILERARIRVRWVECGVPDAVAQAAADACTQPLEWNELVLRIVAAGTVDSGPDIGTLGFAFVDLNAGGGWLAAVYADRVRVMAQAAGADAADLLGRAMAHEIGHLLLGTNRHAPDGLMRASWSGADLRRNRATQWLFGGKEGEVMRRAIASRFKS